MRNTIWTYTYPVVVTYPREGKYVLMLQRRHRVYDKINSIVHKPFKKSGYKANVWGDLWEWSLHRGEARSHAYARFEITKDEADQLSTRKGAKLDLGWPTQSSDEL